MLLGKTRIAEDLLANLSNLLDATAGGLAVTVILVGMLMAASTGIVGATVVTMGLMSLPIMLQRGYPASLATGTICATGTLGQIIPPSIALVLLGDVLSNGYQQAQLSMGIFAPKSISVGDLFAGAIIPGLCLVGLYLAYVLIRVIVAPQSMPPAERTEDVKLTPVFAALAPPLLLIVAVLGSILGGYATPTEAAGVGAFGALVLGLAYGRIDRAVLTEVGSSTLSTTGMVFFILVGASIFSLVFRGYGGDEMVQALFEQMPGGMGSPWHRHVGDLFTRLYSRLYRDNVCGGAHRRASAYGHGYRPDLAGRSYCRKPADIVSDAALWLRAFLSARRRARPCKNGGDYRECYPLLITAIAY